MTTTTLQKTNRVLVFSFLLFIALYYLKGFLLPLVFAGLLSILLLPISLKLERLGIGRVLSIIISILLLVAFFVGIGWLISWQISDLAKDAGKLEQNVTQKISALKESINNSLGIPPEKQQQMVKQQQQSGGSKIGSMVSAAIASVTGMFANSLLVLIYIFLFLYFRGHLKAFILKLVDKHKEAKTIKIIDNSQDVAKKYISGLAMMIVCLWVMYGIGFTIAGVKNPIFFAILCGLLEIIPFIGNITGTAITLLMSLAQGGDSSVLIGILITYALVQFIQSYLLEPLIVGKEVRINPLTTIVGIVAGEFLWGIAGMILAIPLIGMAKVVFDNTPSLKPLGFLFGEAEKGEGNFIDKIKSWFK